MTVDIAENNLEGRIIQLNQWYSVRFKSCSNGIIEFSCRHSCMNLTEGREAPALWMDIREHRSALIVLVDEPDDGHRRRKSVPR